MDATSKNNSGFNDSTTAVTSIASTSSTKVEAVTIPPTLTEASFPLEEWLSGFAFNPFKATIVAKDENVRDFNLRVLLMIICSSMGGFLFGYDTGQISGFLEMKAFREGFGTLGLDGKYAFTNVQTGLIVGMLSIGNFIGCLCIGYFANKYGRRKAVLFVLVIFGLGLVIQMSSKHWIAFIMGRFTAGLGVGSISVLMPLYTCESSPKVIRSVAICSYQLFITIGIAIAATINFGTEHIPNSASYRVPISFGFLWMLILIVGFAELAESPRWDWNRGADLNKAGQSTEGQEHQHRALKTIAMLHGLDEKHPIILSELYEVNSERLAVKALGPLTLWESLRQPKIMCRILLAMALQTAQQLTGANYFFYYGTSIFRGIGIKNSFVTAIILASVNSVGSCLGVALSDRCRRRPSLIVGSIWTGVFMAAFAGVGHFVFECAEEGSRKQVMAGIAMIVFACMFIVGYAMTWGPLVWAVNGEMFPHTHRAMAMGFATSANWLWNFFLAFFTPQLTRKMGFLLGFVFSGCCFSAGLVVWNYQIESKNRSLEEVDRMYKEGVKPRESAKWKPEGDEEEWGRKGSVESGEVMRMETLRPKDSENTLAEGEIQKQNGSELAG